MTEKLTRMEIMGAQDGGFIVTDPSLYGSGLATLPLFAGSLTEALIYVQNRMMPPPIKVDPMVPGGPQRAGAADSADTVIVG